MKYVGRVLAQVVKVGIEESADDDDVPTPGRGRGSRTIRSKSVGSQFKDSLGDLMGTISRTQPRQVGLLLLL